MNTSRLQHKTIYAFGDSIVYGHTAPDKSFMQLIADEYKISLTMNARNGATVIASQDNNIITQVKNAPAAEPDAIVFDGYTNDAYDGVLDKIGSPKGCGATSFDNKSFSGAFEEIIYTMKQKWSNAKLLFITVHKNAARDWSIQCALQNAAVTMCKEWGVEVADVFNSSVLDTRDINQMTEYIIGKSGSHPNEAACRKFYMPVVTEKLLKFFPEV